MATRLTLSQLNKIYLCVVKWSRVFYIETGILGYYLVYLGDILDNATAKMKLFFVFLIKPNNLNGMFK